MGLDKKMYSMREEVTLQCSHLCGTTIHLVTQVRIQGMLLDISLSLTSHMNPLPSTEDLTSCLNFSPSPCPRWSLSQLPLSCVTGMVYLISQIHANPFQSTRRGAAMSVFSHFLKTYISLSQCRYAWASICQEHCSLHPPPSSTSPSLAYSLGIDLKLTSSGRPSMTTFHPPTFVASETWLRWTPWADLGFGDTYRQNTPKTKPFTKTYAQNEIIN